MSKNQKLIKKMIVISIFTAISIVLYIVGPKFSLPFAPSFLVVNFSMLPIFIGLFMMGYKEALCMVLLRFLIKLPTTSTAGVGEVTDLILGSFVVMGTFLGTIIFKGKYKNVGIFGFAFISWILGGVLSNFFALPGYIHLANFPEMAIVKMMPKFMHATIDNYVWKYFILAVIPFNAFIAACVIIVTIPCHLRLKRLYDRIGINDKNDNNTEDKREAK